MDLPNVIRNGTGPVSLVCDYELEEDDAGLVIQWYYVENDQIDTDAKTLIYQWIPPCQYMKWYASKKGEIPYRIE